ncbi:MAG: Transketolase domain protein [Parcubacteria group bacterium GW2011_GWF2_52_12]|uniref:Transketolase n=1 Tax=Candidatus Vogelbacteria bacterium RIFOXYD1_FULL_51_18 TaxID=1802440 RepID=A0A1G2QKR5_9BACT|nr:MAG: Transketolase domain protein [Parcubacteria group bacterium GW2011_GWC1_51_35]KKW24761.1 MAG: Transketolase domain protein [Parcubacteria group bacterium GW2011_GWF2_52_12]KKW27916.1 MAG: Transketolase domain protein [Parcubacteria group bacterium GW2011_GWF1_52_5]KKW34476.1 MAG: Transketolase domain protein [Parcubacteria group bacterium GW2011_GWB1_53_43]OHA61136.1 MAG: transketolase [Candidatus Vogelbacteria bacterium RIFOXYD1_FULL_51_18]
MAHLHDEKVRFLSEKANAIRGSIIEALLEAGSGHTAGPLGMADIFSYLFFHALKHDPKNPFWSERDRLVLSNGHIAPVLYAAMAHAGYFPIEELKTLRKFKSRLQGHPHREWLPGLETSSGPLGSGLSQAVGMALADRIDNGRTSRRYFYALMSDGEQECGEVWEAAQLAAREELHNLIAIIDRNYIQIDGYTEDVMPLDPLKEKWEAFNWHVIEVSGHDFADIDAAVEQAKAVFGKPTLIIAYTVPGKGVPEFEGKYEWHGKPPSREEAVRALAELRSLGGKIKSEHE